MDNRDNLLNFQDRVNLYFDNELPKDQESNLMKEVDADPECNRVFNTEKKYRTFVKDNVKRSAASPDLIQMIKNKVGL